MASRKSQPPRPPDIELDRGQESNTGMVETQASKSIAEAQITIQSALTVAKKFPRDYDAVWARLIGACKRPRFAADVKYQFPRGGSRDCAHVWVLREDVRRCRECNATCIEGPSVYLAREGLRAFGNAWCGLDVVSDTPDERLISAWAWDLETNMRRSVQDLFGKLIYRRNAGQDGRGGYIVPDERELRELTNRRGALAERAAITTLLPSDLIDDALAEAEKTLLNPKDPEGEKKSIILAFMDINVTPEMLEKALGVKIGNAAPKDLTWMRGVYKSIRDGNSTWGDYVGGKKTVAPPPKPAATRPQEGQQAQAPASTQPSAAPASSTSDQPSAKQDPAVPRVQGGITDNEKGQVHRVAELMKWKKKGSPGDHEDALHLYLKKAFGAESVRDIKKADLVVILNTLAEGPEAAGFKSAE